jgi:hypothetical protein
MTNDRPQNEAASGAMGCSEISFLLRKLNFMQELFSQLGFANNVRAAKRAVIQEPLTLNGLLPIFRLDLDDLSRHLFEPFGLFPIPPIPQMLILAKQPISPPGAFFQTGDKERMKCCLQLFQSLTFDPFTLFHSAAPRNFALIIPQIFQIQTFKTAAMQTFFFPPMIVLLERSG